MKHEEISQKYAKWIIEYQSINFKEAIYFLWITDMSGEENLDQMLLSEKNKILTNESPRQLLNHIENSKHEFTDSKNLNKWLEESLSCKELSFTVYNFKDLQENQSLKVLNNNNLSEIVNLINIFEDYLYQIQDDNLAFRKENSSLNQVWEFYYNEILFKKLEQKHDIENHKAYPNSDTLKKEYNNLIMEFESKFETTTNE